MQTYTPPGGMTIPGNQVNDANQALQGLQKIQDTVGGMVNNRPADLATAKTNMMNENQVPQASNQFQMTAADFQKMSAADSDFAAKYTAPPSTGQLTGVNGYTPTALTNPSTTTAEMQSDTNSTLGMLDKLSGFISGGYNNVKSGVASNEASYRDSLQGLLGLAGQYTDIYKSLKQAGLTQKDMLDMQLQAMDRGATYNPDTGTLTKGVDPIAEVIKQGGSELLKKASGAAERKMLAQDIISSGGVSQYRKTLPYENLLSDKENTALQTQTGLLSQIDDALPLFAHDVMGGTGPLGQYVPGFMAGPLTREKRRVVTELNSAYQNMISGKTISDKEAKRLSQFLPSSSKTETQNSEDLQHLKDGIVNAQSLFEQSKREGLSIDEAYKKYGNQSNSGSSKTVTMQSPDGKQYTVDPTEVSDAMRNGWRKL